MGKMCKIDKCTNRSYIRGLCNRHYLQVKRHGKTFVTIREHRPAEIVGDIARIPIGLNGKDGFALVDKEDAWLDGYRWSLSHGYPSTRIDGKSVLLHRLLLKAPNEKDVDHIDGNPFNSKKDNLRLCTRAQNNYNRKVPKDHKTGYKGVYWHKSARKFAARIQHNKRSMHLGLFATVEEAASAYDLKAKEYFGEFARLNHGSN